MSQAAILKVWYWITSKMKNAFRKMRELETHSWLAELTMTTLLSQTVTT